MSSKSSPSPSPARDSVEMQRTETNGSGKDGSSSLKRVREGSLEPTQAGASIPDPVATKKNRIGSSSKNSSGPNDIAEVEGEDQSPPAEDVEIDTEGTATTASRNEEKPVGEVRKKVEKMSYEEGKENPASAPDVEIEDKEVERPNGDESWEKIDKDEVEGSNGDSLKRKALNRSESSYAQEADDISSKRAKDVAEDTAEESNSTKAPSPKKTQKTFSSFASSASPFAALKSPSPAPTSDSASTLAAPTPASAKKPQATFGSFSGASSPFVSAASPAPPSSTPTSSQTTETKTTSAPAKKPQSTFGAFSSSSSPFAATKSTSAFGSAPVKGSAFGTYSSTSSAFSTKKSTPVEGEQKSEAGPSNFGEILKESGGDDETEEEKVEMQEQDVTTGEEDEETVFQTRAKLYTNDRRTGWKERGVGLLKLNVNQSDGSGARLVMRADGVLRLILNSRIYKGITTYPDGKMVRMTLPEDGKMMIVCFRMSNTKQVDDFMEQVEKNQPESWVPELKPTLD
ncbi:hypothetical protein I302_100136 [Kwoniella bestiolae CBS 10118]|uniref:RanBD1 domain-containing protein n=1 Tax=Kwoniella bestiolae CBS 10118 TaxID=1296100 RepID=A0A1B9G4C3_9TREE|nr:hypothetical protein I302_03512 [Kwoniella bestiolae CBS 10118]OCF25838.1 hypothetical protein I302_03512 [Kwoniella bestiolae CBS 10118]